MRDYHVYILASLRRVLYIGMTSDLRSRVWKHKHGMLPGFTSHYRVNRLVHFEAFRDAKSAIAREKQLKGWRRSRKEQLIMEANAGWIDLSADWFDGSIGVQVDPGCSAIDIEGPSLRSG